MIVLRSIFLSDGSSSLLAVVPALFGPGLYGAWVCRGCIPASFSPSHLGRRRRAGLNGGACRTTGSGVVGWFDLGAVGVGVVDFS